MLLSVIPGVALALNILNRVAAARNRATVGVRRVGVLVVDGEGLPEGSKLAVDVEESVALAQAIVAVLSGLVARPVVELAAVNSVIAVHCETETSAACSRKTSKISRIMGTYWHCRPESRGQHGRRSKSQVCTERAGSRSS